MDRNFKSPLIEQYLHQSLFARRRRKQSPVWTSVPGENKSLDSMQKRSQDSISRVWQKQWCIFWKQENYSNWLDRQWCEGRVSDQSRYNFRSANNQIPSFPLVTTSWYLKDAMNICRCPSFSKRWWAMQYVSTDAEFPSSLNSMMLCPLKCVVCEYARRPSNTGVNSSRSCNSWDAGASGPSINTTKWVFSVKRPFCFSAKRRSAQWAYESISSRMAIRSASRWEDRTAEDTIMSTRKDMRRMKWNETKTENRTE